MSFEGNAPEVIVFKAVRYLTKYEAMIGLHMVFFLASDSLLAYKTTLCYCIGSYLMTILKLIYQEPRPYWTHTDIRVPDGECDFSFGNPTLATFNFIFFFGYSTYMQLYRYVRINDRKPWKIWVTVTLIVILEMVIIVMFWVNGKSFLYQ